MAIPCFVPSYLAPPEAGLSLRAFAAGRGAYASIGLALPKYRGHSDVVLSEEHTVNSDLVSM